VELSAVTPVMRRARLLVRWQNKRPPRVTVLTYVLSAGNASQVSDTCSTRPSTATVVWA
jgi:hypothetical protein